MVVVQENVTATFIVVEPICVAVVVHDGVYFRVGDVAASTGAATGGSRGVGANVLAVRSSAAGFDGSEAPAIAADADDDLVGRNTGFGDHDKRILGLCGVDMGPQTIAPGAAL